MLTEAIISSEEVFLSDDVKRIMSQFADHVHFTKTGSPLTKEECDKLVEEFDTLRNNYIYSMNKNMRDNLS